jgi:hypothetical protein
MTKTNVMCHIQSTNKQYSKLTLQIQTVSQISQEQTQIIKTLAIRLFYRLQKKVITHGNSYAYKQRKGHKINNFLCLYLQFT